MLQPARMRKVRILVLGEDVEILASGLGHLGVIHLTEAQKEVKGLRLAEVETDAEMKRWQGLRGRIEHLGRMLKVEVTGGERPERGFHAPERIEEEVAELEEEMNVWLKRELELTDQTSELRELIGQVESYAGIPLPLDRLEDFSFLHFAVGMLPERRMKSVETELGPRALLVPLGGEGGQARVLAVSSKKGRWALETTLTNHGFKGEKFGEKYLGTPDELMKQARLHLEEAERELRDLTRKLNAKGRERGEDLRGWHYRVRIAERMAEAKGHFATTEATRLIVGWVPLRRVVELHDEVLKLTQGRAVVEVLDPHKHPEEYKDVPTLFEHSRLLKPFELLVTGFGIPEYNEIEPTILLAVTFLFMFGAMFGDIGHGLVLVIGGLLWRRWAKTTTMKQFGLLIMLAGGAGMLGGLMYGSMFGAHAIAGVRVPQLWAEPLDRAQTLLMTMIGFGVVMVSLGLVLNAINRLRNRDVAGTFLDRFGVVGMVLYWGAIGLVLRYVILEKGEWWESLLVLGPPLVIMVVADLVLNALGKKKEEGVEGLPPESMGMRVFEGLVGTLEACIAYLTNTISFVRVGAFALAHAGFCMAVFEIEKLVRGLPGGPAWSVMVVVLGNAMIIALEGLVVSIQAIRLEYYEFFTKFFRGGGKTFEPFGLE